MNLLGMRFGRWTVVESTGKNKRGRDTWRCLCDCGVEKPTVIGLNLRSGISTSCGCGQRDAAVRAKTKHGHMSGGVESLTHVSWRGMIDRCSNHKRQDSSSYSGRGITVCDRWNVFSYFLEDMGERPSRSHEIDRIDNSDGYKPGNCRWVTDAVNSRNRRTNRTIETPLGGMLLCDAVLASGLNYGTLVGRLSRGWPAVRLFDAPRHIEVGIHP